MTQFSVSEAKNRSLRERMEQLGIREEDLDEKFIRSSGKGGQHVNKTSTCVWLKHLPTGIEVKCMAERSQSMNRFLARREVVERVEALAGHPTRRDLAAEKIRKQKAKRKRRAVSKYDKIDDTTPGDREPVAREAVHRERAPAVAKGDHDRE